MTSFHKSLTINISLFALSLSVSPVLILKHKKFFSKYSFLLEKFLKVSFLCLIGHFRPTSSAIELNGMKQSCMLRGYFVKCLLLKIFKLGE